LKSPENKQYLGVISCLVKTPILTIFQDSAE